MAVQPPAKTTSRWGSFLQQAVAGVESRLDTILADEDSVPKLQEKDLENGAKRGNGSVQSTGRASTDVPRTSSITRKNDRLQERLAKAVVARSGVKSSGPSTTSSHLPSRSSSPSNPSLSPRTSLDTNRGEITVQVDGRDNARKSLPDLKTRGCSTEDATTHTDIPQTDHSPVFTEKLSIANKVSSTMIQSSNKSLEEKVSPMLSLCQSIDDSSIDSQQQLKEPTPMTSIQYQEIIDRLRSDYKTAESRRQEETHIYLERFDALQAKLQYLTREALEIAKSAKGEAYTGSWEEKLAVKDEKIALLMEEGQNLSQNELKHMSTIRKLRMKSAEDEKNVSLYKNAAESCEKLLQKAQERVRRLEASEKAESERAQTLRAVENELQRIKAENVSRATAIESLQHELTEGKTSSEPNEVQKYKGLYETEKKITSGLRDELSSLKLEAEVSHDRLSAELRVSRENAEREKQQARRMEQDLRNELSAMESRLEIFRARIEEASSTGSSDWQVKLLRQIETLQTQYSAASENWRGIETSLLSRIASLEKEKDEISRRETDLRRKAREASAKAHRVEESLQSNSTKIQALEDERNTQNQQIATLQANLAKAEKDFQTAKVDPKLGGNAWQAAVAERHDEPKTDGIELLSPRSVHPQPRADSPAVLSSKQSRLDRASPRGYRQQSTPLVGLSTASLPFSDYPRGRRPSAQPSHASSSGALGRDGSLPNGSHLLTEQAPDLPSAYTDQHDDFFDGVVTPATLERTINDMISVSTAAAGPSVQLVERMSAAVRRLESDKASAKDQSERLASQRDEARKQIVEMMREVEEKKAADQKIRVLQAENEEMNKRYQTTLEMLGEKSELVEELRADVADVKQMYRDLVERTVQ